MGKITFIVTAHGNVIEVETKLVTGKAAMGYYNLMGGKSPLQGHFKYGDISEIGFVTMPFLGRESHFAAFFTTSGEVAYSMYVGREKHKLIESAKENSLPSSRSTKLNERKRMKVLVAYATVTGNTEIIARAIASAIPAPISKNCRPTSILRITTLSSPVSGATKVHRMKYGRHSRKRLRPNRLRTSERWAEIPTANADRLGLTR